MKTIPYKHVESGTDVLVFDEDDKNVYFEAPYIAKKGGGIYPTSMSRSEFYKKFAPLKSPAKKAEA